MADIFGENAGSPVYVQRYVRVIETLEKNGVKKVVDFGCSDLNFAKRLKHMPGLREVAAVDVDKNLLEQSSYKMEPLAFDYVCRRDESFKASIYNGSVADKDDRLLGFDAVTCIELIEHLMDDVLTKLPSVIFGFIKPIVAIFTTPNADFNVLFPDFKGFRHWDHKFEWTRKEFQNWCDSVVAKYPEYEAEISGIGKGPKGSEHLGCCSQMVLFKRSNSKFLCEHQRSPSLGSSSSSSSSSSVSPVSSGGSFPYQLINQYDYPYKRDTNNGLGDDTDSVTNGISDEETDYEDEIEEEAKENDYYNIQNTVIIEDSWE